MRMILTLIAVAAMPATTFAQSAELPAAQAAVEQILNDPAKQKAYCEALKLSEQISEETGRVEALGDKASPGRSRAVADADQILWRPGPASVARDRRRLRGNSAGDEFCGAARSADQSALSGRREIPPGSAGNERPLPEIEPPLHCQFSNRCELLPRRSPASFRPEVLRAAAVHRPLSSTGIASRCLNTGRERVGPDEGHKPSLEKLMQKQKS